MAEKSLAYKALVLFKAQIQRHLGGSKVVIAPTPIREKGVVVKLSLFKTTSQSGRVGAGRSVRMRVAVEGAAESQTGLDQAVGLIEKIDIFLRNAKNLEGKNGEPIPNTRITQTLSDEDSMLDSPDGTTVQDVLDERHVTIFLNKNTLEGV